MYIQKTTGGYHMKQETQVSIKEKKRIGFAYEHKGTEV